MKANAEHTDFDDDGVVITASEETPPERAHASGRSAPAGERNEGSPSARGAVDAARLGNDERLGALRELDRQARRLEAVATGPSFEALVQEGWADVGELLPTDAPVRRVSARAGWRRAARRAQLELPGLTDAEGESSRHSG